MCGWTGEICSKALGDSHRPDDDDPTHLDSSVHNETAEDIDRTTGGDRMDAVELWSMDPVDSALDPSESWSTDPVELALVGSTGDGGKGRADAGDGAGVDLSDWGSLVLGAEAHPVVRSTSRACAQVQVRCAF